MPVEVLYWMHKMLRKKFWKIHEEKMIFSVLFFVKKSGLFGVYYNKSNLNFMVSLETLQKPLNETLIEL